MQTAIVAFPEYFEWRFPFVRSVWPVVVVEALPHRELLCKVYVVLVGEEWVERIFIGCG